jgi:MFS family permease
MVKLRFPFLVLLLLLGTCLRVWDLPHRDELRHVDENPYIFGSLSLLEGITPPYKYAPAGPQTWAGWLFEGAESAKYFLHPPPSQRRLDIRLRPFFAVNDAIWDAYADEGPLRWVWILVAYPFIIWSIYEAFVLGEYMGGLAGGALMGGLTALLPMYVEMSNQARPYMMGWAMAIIAISLAVRSTSRRGRIISAIFFGLAIGSRVEILALLPIAWSELWARRKQDRFIEPFFLFNVTTLITMLLVAPWLLTNLIGNLRIIATVRISEPVQGPVTLTRTIRDIAWHQGLLFVPLIAMAGAFLPRRLENRPRWILNLYLFLLVVSMLKATGFGLQHQGAPLIAMLFLAAIGIGGLSQLTPQVATGIAAVLLVLPLARAAQGVIIDRRSYVPEDPVAWIEQHVPAGTIVYTPLLMHGPLPTVAASDALWAQVNDNNAWEQKFTAGMTRFHLDSSEFPRALSQENMLVELALRRGFFILGSRSDIKRPRYDIRVYQSSPVFSIQDLPTEFARTGGVILWEGARSDSSMPDMAPTVDWPSREGDEGTYIYCKNVKLVDYPPSR